MKKSKNIPEVPGVFAIDKPLGMSSAKAVAIVKYWARRVTGEKKIKVGHGGTLDPLATGILVIAVGRAHTREIETYVSAEKEYVAKVHLGRSSTTDDEEGKKEKIQGPVPSFIDVIRACDQFVGDIVQIPPIFSAIKKDGVPAYKKARAGEDIIMAPRTVTIYEIEVLSYIYPDITIRVRCGKGTYIRALARDLGEALGSAAYMSALTRTRVGNFSLEESYHLEKLDNACRNKNV